MNTKIRFSQGAKPRVKKKNTFGAHNKIIIDPTINNANCLFVRGLTLQYYSKASATRTEPQLLSSRFASNLMFPAC